MWYSSYTNSKKNTYSLLKQLIFLVYSSTFFLLIASNSFTLCTKDKIKHDSCFKKNDNILKLKFSKLKKIQKKNLISHLVSLKKKKHFSGRQKPCKISSLIVNFRRISDKQKSVRKLVIGNFNR